MKVFVAHILACCIGLIALIICKNSIDKYWDKKYPISFVNAKDAHLANYNYLQPDVNLTIAHSIKQGIPLVFGSSELSSSHLKAVCYNFFKEKGIKLQTMGHAGCQCFAISSILAANANLLKEGRIVINLSPVWFEGNYARKGTDIECFLEYNNIYNMQSVLTNTILPKAYKNYYSQYISKKLSSINSPNALVNLLAFQDKNKILYAPFNAINQFIYNQQYANDWHLQTLQAYQQSIEKTTLRYSFFKPVVNWDSLYRQAISAFEEQSTNNNLGVENNYYSTWLKGKRLKLIEPVSNNQEFEDFKMLLQLCVKTNCKPIFTITPINTLCYANPKDIEPIMNDVMTELDTYGFSYLNLFTNNLKRYEKGVLEDIMHPGEYGWYQLDKYMMDEFGSN